MVNRGYHSTTTKYNVLYNGNLAFEQGLTNLRSNYYDNFWSILPIERMQVEERLTETNEPKDPDFQLAEEKATKAIQKHSMYMGGREKNPQMDEAYLMLGKSRYYDNRFIPALEAFNYILYKYPGSGNINEARVWREKTNLRLSYDELAIENLKELLKEERLKDQVKVDALATLAQAYINLEHLDSAAVPLKEARDLTSLKEERARYTFILGQIASSLNDKTSAYSLFQEVIDMKRKSPRQYTIQSHAQQFVNRAEGEIDSVAFLDKYSDLLEDRENRPYLDLINRQLGLYYSSKTNYKRSIDYFKESVKQSKGDEQLKARNYLDIGEIYFNTASYELAGNYYDSAISILPTRSREAYKIAKKRESLHDVVLFEKMAKENDSILYIVNLSDSDRREYFQKYADELRKQDFRKLNSELGGDSGANNVFNMPDFGSAIEKSMQSSGGAGQGKTGFYFYSQNAVSYGKLDFKKRWGNRALADNWRWGSSMGTANADVEEDLDVVADSATSEKFDDPRYNIETYLKEVPTDLEEIASIKKDRDFAYFQLGSIYSEKFAEFEMGADKLEALLLFEPEERLVLPALYKLYKIYSSIDENKAGLVKARIISEYPDSRYALLLQNKLGEQTFAETSEEVYVRLKREYESGEYLEVLQQLNSAIEQFSGDDYLSKLELLKALVVGRLEGLEAYKTSLNYVGLTYASTSEGKEAERILSQDVPSLAEKELVKDDVKTTNWKIIYAVNVSDLDKMALLESKLKLYAMDRQSYGVKFSKDYYNADTVFFVLHGMNSKANAESVVSFLRISPDYGIDREAFYISSDNYAVVQIKKIWDVFLQVEKE
ncbi:protein involved in gliding motility SprE [Myroides guanonis]|uniref:Protein involved in gliding motility SprE n=2 Tax=Myroides guanonis TaxID=1150112 RepID=A0A1I3RHJ7_9FLAO|nr:protein involved in gliding motility SprE [Myroides guanonis]